METLVESLFTKKIDNLLTMFNGQARAFSIVQAEQDCLSWDFKKAVILSQKELKRNNMIEDYYFPNLQELNFLKQFRPDLLLEGILADYPVGGKISKGTSFILVKRRTEITEKDDIKTFLEKLHERGTSFDNLEMCFYDKECWSENKNTSAAICRGEYKEEKFTGQIRHYGCANSVFDTYKISLGAITKIIDSKN